MPDQPPTASVIVVSNEIADRVRAYASALAEERASEVEGFAAARDSLAGFGSILGRPDAVIAGGVNMLSGSDCNTTGGVFKPTDFDCADKD